MPLLENDVIFAYLNEYDPNHNIAERIFQKLQNGEIDVEISSVSLIEMELIYRSEKMYRLNNIEKTIFENKFLNKIYGNGLKEIIKIANSLGNKNSLKWIRFLFNIYFSYS
jgi:predicted nucleic acid-binding protein